MGNKEFYKFAKAYDIAFQGRDYEDEYDFLLWCYNNHAKNKIDSKLKPGFLEVACGPAHHAREFVRRGWNSVAVDLSEEMLEYAKILSEKENISMKYLAADMSDFSIEEKVDLAGIFTESITHLVTNEQIISHLKSVAACINSGGIYVIETSHPQYFFPDDEPNYWEAKENGMNVKILFGKPDDKYDPVLQQWEVTTKLEIEEKGQPTEIVESKSKHRWYLAQELRALIELSGVFDDFWFYGNMEVPPGKLDNTANSDCMVVVLRVR